MADAGTSSTHPDATPPGDGGLIADGPSAGAPKTLTPTAIPLSDPEIANPQRGAFDQYGVKPPPSGWPYKDVYWRFSWRNLEPTEGNYQWSLIDDEIAQAKAQGGKFGMRVMPADSTKSGTDIPQYLMDLMPLGFYFTYPGTSTQVYAPDWNDPDYMSRAEALIRAIAARYAKNPAFGWIEICPYGDWSEWHVYNWPYPSPTGAKDMTLANRKHLIDVFAQVFPADKLVQMVDSANGPNATMTYAMAKSPLIGVRGDCFGDPLYDQRIAQLNAVAPNRWQTAPILAEFCGGGSGQYTTGLTQVKDDHVAMIGGNFGNYSSHSAQEQQDFDMLRKLSGYRYVLDSVTVPSVIPRGVAVSFKAAWTNAGVAPVHHGWTVVYQLANASGAVAWETPSSLDLRTALPGASSVTDTLTVPASVTPGTYTLRVIVRDADGYYSPVALAITGRLGDGSYPLGTLVVE